MKITIAKSHPTGHVELRLHDFSFYLDMDDVEKMATSNGVKSAYDLKIMHVVNQEMIIFEHPSIYNNHGGICQVKAYRIEMNTKKFFSRVLDLMVQFPKRTFELETKKFEFPDTTPPLLGWTAIMNHKRFMAHGALKLAVREFRSGTHDELIYLRDRISNLLGREFSISNDGKWNFYFWNPKQYNGGIIWHEGCGYSTHT